MRRTSKTSMCPTPKPGDTGGNPPKSTKGKRLTEAQMFKRDERIRRMYGTGKFSVRALASKIGLSKSRIGEIVY